MTSANRNLRRGAGRLAGLAAGLCLALAACQKPPEKAAGPPPPPPDTLALALDPMFTESGAQGMVVAVVQGDDVTLRGYGRQSPGDPQAPDGATLVRLESISKLLTSDLMVKLAAQKQLNLTDPLQTYAPRGDRVPQAKGARPIELIDLATHTSGLPRIAPVDPKAPAAEAETLRWAWLARRKPAIPGVAAQYSNIGFDLLGDALANAAKASYPEALTKWVTRPAGMADTTARPNAGQCARLLTPDTITSEKPCADTSASAASGGVYSTAADMAAWMKRQLAANPTPDVREGQLIRIRPSALTSAKGLDVAGPPDGIGLAWIELAATTTHPLLLEKTGGGGGFMTYIVLDTARRVGVFVAIDKIGYHRIQALSSRANDLVGALAAQR